MLSGRLARLTALAIVLIAIASATFRVVTAPERMAKRRAADAQACAAEGGSMTKVGNDLRCTKHTPSQ